MALLQIKNVDQDVMLGLWRISESVEEFISGNAALRQVQQEFPPYKNEARILEKLAVYALLYRMTGTERPLHIQHLDSGRPELEGYHIGISHTKGFAALILSPTKPVAVDIEYMADRVNRVAARFIRSDEKATTTLERLINWCAKETIYKLFSEENLDYADMRLQPFECHSQGVFNVEDLKEPKFQEVHYTVTAEYVMTHSIFQTR